LELYAYLDKESIFSINNNIKKTGGTHEIKEAILEIDLPDALSDLYDMLDEIYTLQNEKDK